MPLGADAARWLARLSLIDQHSDLAQPVRDLLASISSQMPVVSALVDEANACLDADAPALDAIAERWTERGRQLDALRSRICAAVVRSRADATRAAAIDQLRELRETCVTLGAEYDANLTGRLLRELGTRSRAKSRQTKVGNLTKRELEIARLVATGKKNSEVASHLYLAEKTVAAHLSNIYGKVGVKSRVQLAAWLAEHDVDVVPAETA
jgi:DNA-binding CsgD family transcriptional regulator